MTFSLNRKSGRVRSLRLSLPRAATMNPEGANYFQDFARITSRAPLLAILVTRMSRRREAHRGARRSNLKTRKVVQKRRSIVVKTRTSALLAPSLLYGRKNRGAARTQKLATERPDERN